MSNSVDQIVLAPKSYPFKQLNLNLKLEIRITVGQELKVELITRNMASASVSYFAALHTYFKINDIDNLILGGINSDYFDKTRSMSLMPALENYTINEETDRVHIGSSPNITVEDMQLKTQIKSKGNDSIVVWNPWKMLSNSMVDMNEFGYRHMICVETARTQNGILEGNQTHTLTQIIS